MPSVALRNPANSMSLPAPGEAQGVGAGQSGSEISGVSSSDLLGLDRSMTRVFRSHTWLTTVSDWKAKDRESGDHERPFDISGALVANCHVVEAPVTRFWTTIASGVSVMSVKVWYASNSPFGLTAGSWPCATTETAPPPRGTLMICSRGRGPGFGGADPPMASSKQTVPVSAETAGWGGLRKSPSSTASERMTW